MVHDAFEHCDKDHSSFKDMIEDTEKPLYIQFKAYKVIRSNETVQYKRTLLLV